jgi:dimethylargininase
MMSQRALTRAISTGIVRCELTHLAREPIDVLAAQRQHDAYEGRLTDAGCLVERLAADGDLPDSVFIEDMAVVFDEVAVIARPGASSRRAETAAVAGALSGYRPVVHIEAPATMDGGDVLAIGKRVFVGESSRTNTAAASQLARHLAPHGYTVHIVPVRRCLHLKSAVTALDGETLLINREWVPAELFRPLNLLDVHPAEADGANALRVGDAVIYPEAFPRTRARIEAVGMRVLDVNVSELAKAEGSVTCCSLTFEFEV